MAAGTIAGAMFASLIFSLLSHFLLLSPDNVWMAPICPWRDVFIISAVMTAIAQATGFGVGLLAAKTWTGAAK